VISQGIYASVDYDFSEQLTLSTEVRWQREQISQVFAQSATNELSFDNILPRIIVRYKANENSMFYASYSKGVLPGKANDAVQAADDRELAQYRATQPNVERFLDEEELNFLTKNLHHQVLLIHLDHL
jgi:outer membrane receptor protein involved in Fe transport